MDFLKAEKIDIEGFIYKSEYQCNGENTLNFV